MCAYVFLFQSVTKGLDAVKVLTQPSSTVSCMQYSQGGPIIAVQVENEYGVYATDDTYVPFIKEVGSVVLQIRILD